MKKKIAFICSSCGNQELAWSGKCSACDQWGTIEEIELDKKKSNKQINIGSGKKALRLKDISLGEEDRWKSSVREFDRVLGNGLVKDSVTILTASPGAGKSTLLLEMSKSYASKGLKVLYASGEESDKQIRSRAERIMKEIPDGIWLISTSILDEVIFEAKAIGADIVMVDSIQTFALADLESRPGSPSQTLEGTAALVDLAKSSDKSRAVIMIGHMTKKDEMAGLRTLEHMVDTVLYLSNDLDEDLRLLSSSKNRFGRSGEIGLFKMQEDGIKEVSNPSEEFITKRDEDVVGSAVTMVKEGSRHMAVEIESLISQSFQAYPTRISQSMSKDRLNTLIAILEERSGFKMEDKNVILKTTGGLKLLGQDSDLACMMSISSSYKSQAIPQNIGFLGEVGLTGELRPVKQLEQRIEELERLGYEKVFCGGKDLTKNFNDIEVLRANHVNEVLKKVFL